MFEQFKYVLYIDDGTHSTSIPDDNVNSAKLITDELKTRLDRWPKSN